MPQLRPLRQQLEDREDQLWREAQLGGSQSTLALPRPSSLLTEVYRPPTLYNYLFMTYLANSSITLWK